MAEPQSAAPAGRLVSTIARLRAALRASARAVWRRDRTALGPAAALGNRVARIASWTIRGILRHRLSLQAAALTYYTVFAVVPLLVVTLGIVKVVGIIPAMAPQLAADAARQPGGNALLREALQAILTSVDQSGQRVSGILGLAALLFSVIRMFAHVADAIDIIASSRRGRLPIFYRAVACLVLLALPPVLLVITGAVAAAAAGKMGAAASHLLAVLPGLRLGVGVLLVVGALWLALAVFYRAAGRAHIAIGSAFVGGAVGAVLVVGVLWAFAQFQIGVSKANTLYSGMAAVPVFMLWTYSSWFVVLIGAEVGVGHSLDHAAARGAGSFPPDDSGTDPMFAPTPPPRSR